MSNNCNIITNKADILTDNIDFILSSDSANTDKLISEHTKSGDILVLSSNDSADRHDIYIGGDHIAGGWGFSNKDDVTKLETIVDKWDNLYANVYAEDNNYEYSISTDKTKTIKLLDETQIGINVTKLSSSSQQVSLYESIIPKISNICVNYSADVFSTPLLTAYDSDVCIPITTRIKIRSISFNYAVTSTSFSYEINFVFKTKTNTSKIHIYTGTIKLENTESITNSNILFTIPDKYQIYLQTEYTEFYVEIIITDIKSRTSTSNSVSIYWLCPYIYNSSDLTSAIDWSYTYTNKNAAICSNGLEINNEDIEFSINIDTETGEYCFIGIPSYWENVKIINKDSNISANWQLKRNSSFNVGNVKYVIYQSNNLYSGETNWILTNK